jgi:nicotinamidase-related amidase
LNLVRRGPFAVQWTATSLNRPMATTFACTIAIATGSFTNALLAVVESAEGWEPVVTTALIIGDVQRGITSNYPFARQVVPPLTELLPRARAAGALVVFVHFALRANGADVPPSHALLKSFYEAGDTFHEGSAGTEVDLPVAAEDVVVRKRRASAFAGTDLDIVLRARGVDHLTIAGVATSAMVAATCYDAADRGYQLTVLRDGCADGDPAMHDFFMDAVFPSRGFEVVSCAGWRGGAR